MGDWFLGEIRLFGGMVPKGWMPCDGQMLSATQYAALFGLFGNRFGGNGSTTFALPDLRGRAIVGQVQLDPNYALGVRAGSETAMLVPENLPGHTHDWQASTQPPNSARPINTLLTAGSSASGPLYAPFAADDMATMSGSIVGTVGGGQAHPNMQPFTVLTFCIATQGSYPQRG